MVIISFVENSVIFIESVALITISFFFFEKYIPQGTKRYRVVARLKLASSRISDNDRKVNQFK